MRQAKILKKEQVYDELKARIERGVFVPGEKLPRELELAKQLNVSTITLRIALQRLAEAGIIERIHGRGTFVSQQGISAVKPETIMIIHATGSGIEESWHHIVPSVNAIAAQNNYNVTVTTNEALEIFSDIDIRSSVINDNIIGIIAILSTFKGDEPIVDKLKAAQVPVIIAGGNLTDSEITGFASVVVNSQRAWEAAVMYLSEQGFSRVGVVGLQTCSGQFRGCGRDGTMKLIKENGMYTDDNLIKDATFDFSEILMVVKDLISLPQPPDVILCYSDFVAVHVYRALDSLGLKIPDDIAVMGLCGFPDAQRLSPSLSTIDFEYSEIGRMAFEMIINPERWFDSDTGQGKLRAKQFKLRARQSTKQLLEAPVRSPHRNYSSRVQLPVQVA
jgi:LacI family sucrose operon transcriptional repressor